jgi:hypothetical protein
MHRNEIWHSLPSWACQAKTIPAATGAISHAYQNAATATATSSQKRGRESFLGGIFTAFLLTFSLEGELDGLPLRVSNEGLRRPRVARAQKIIRLHSCVCFASKKGTWPLPSQPSEAARWTSTGDHLACPLLLRSSLLVFSSEVRGLSDVRTPLAGFFSILLNERSVKRKGLFPLGRAPSLLQEQEETKPTFT